MKNKKKGRFGQFIVVYVLFFVAAAIIAVRYFTPTFREYEENLPKNVANAYVSNFDEEKFRELTAEFIAGLDPEIETPEESFRELSSLFKGSVSCVRDSATVTDNSCAYFLSTEDGRLGRIMLETPDEKRGGFAEWIHPRHWYVAEEELEDFGARIKTASISVPEGITVVFGNKTLTDDDMEGEKQAFASLKDFYADYPNLPRLVTYTVDGFICDHEFRCFNAEGEPVEFSGDIAEAEAYATDTCTDAEKEAITAFCKDFIDRFTAFNANGGKGFYYNLDYLREILVPGTTYYNNLALAKEMISYTRPHNYSVDGLTMTSFIRLDGTKLVVGFTYLYSEAYSSDGTRKQASCDVTLFLDESTESYLVESCLTGPAVAVE